jgi:hypothetical protein
VRNKKIIRRLLENRLLEKALLEQVYQEDERRRLVMRSQ